MTDRSAAPASPEPRKEYAPPCAVRIGNQWVGAGECIGTGSSDVEYCEADGNSANSRGCTMFGHSADIQCNSDGNSAKDACQSNGVSPTNSCGAGSGNV